MSLTYEPALELQHSFVKAVIRKLRAVQGYLAHKKQVERKENPRAAAPAIPHTWDSRCGIQGYLAHKKRFSQAERQEKLRAAAQTRKKSLCQTGVAHVPGLQY